MMKIKYSAIALGSMLMAFSSVAAGLSQDRIPELQREARTEAKSTTLVGCVARGAAAGSYVLTNATTEGETVAKDAFARIVIVLSGADVDVSKHVGHRVSVTGLYGSEELAVGTTGTNEKPAAAEAASQDDKKTTRTFRVKSLAMVADSCSQSADQP